FKEKNWSIGGSADALILVVFLDKLMKLNWLTP
ncbi:TPA: triphosphoribosyl-dephospho-CoA synthase CitG, partial [Enterococcus faecalis]